jgi:hypothetical protein
MPKPSFALPYLRAESLRLSAECNLLVREFEALREIPFDPVAHASYRRKLRHFRGLLANHKLAWEWTQYPPCAVSSPRPLYFSAVLVRRTDFPIGVTDDAQNSSPVV